MAVRPAQSYSFSRFQHQEAQQHLHRYDRYLREMRRKRGVAEKEKDCTCVQNQARLTMPASVALTPDAPSLAEGTGSSEPEAAMSLIGCNRSLRRAGRERLGRSLSHHVS